MFSNRENPAQNGPVDQETDPLGQEESGHNERFEGLLDQGRDISGIKNEIVLKPVDQGRIDVIADPGRQGAAEDGQQQGLQADQLVAVHEDQGQEENQDRQDGDQNFQDVRAEIRVHVFFAPVIV